MLKYFQQFRLQLWHLIVSLIVLQILIAFLTYNSVLSFDESIWQYIGRNWFRHGLVPYAGGIDNKTPLIYMIYGISDFLFGVNYWFPRLIAIACQTTGIYFVYRITKHVAGKQAGILAVTIYGLSLLWRNTNGKMVSLTQTYEITFLIISFFLFISAQTRRRLFYSGCFAGIALAFRFSAAFSILIILIALFQKRIISNTFLFLAGVSTSVISIFILFILMGINFNDIITYSFLDNFVSGSVTDHPLEWKIEQFANAFLYSDFIIFYPFIITYIFIKRKVDVFIGWLITAFISIAVIGMFAQAHLKELLPPLSIISAISIAYLVNTYKIPIRPFYIIILITFFPKTIEPLLAIKKMLNERNINQTEACKEPYQENEDSKKRLGLWIKSNTQSGETVYVAGYEAQVQAYSCRLSPSIYFNATQTPLAKKRLFLDLNNNKPAMIIIPLFSKYTNLVNLDIQTFLNGIIARDYYFDRCLYSYNIYRKKAQ